MNHLIMHLTNIDNPYSEGTYDKEMWGKLQLFHLVDNDKTSLILEIKWDLTEFTEWFPRSINSIRKDEFISPHNESHLRKDTIIEEYRRLRTKDYVNDEDEYVWLLFLEHYAESHDLKTALAGSKDCPSVLIGRRGDIGEIGIFKVDHTILNYTFDLDEFLVESLQEIRKFVYYWNKTQAKESNS